MVEAYLLAAGVVMMWAAPYGVLLWATRPARPVPGPATARLADEPPAVANLLVNRWRLTEDAMQATLLDLAARGHIELRQAGDGSSWTVARPRAGDAPGMTAYERRMTERITGLAARDEVPLAALAFHNKREGQAWRQRFRAEVIADARRRGLSRRRFGPLAMGLLVAGALLTAVPLKVLAERAGLEVQFAWVIAVALASLALRYPGERDTDPGQAAAAHWLGVRDWLRGQGTIEHLPAVAAEHWDRYLPYGAALGVARRAGGELDLGLGTRVLVWSHRGGMWHRVRVRYPHGWARLGRPAAHLVVRSLRHMAIGLVLALFHAQPRRWRLATQYVPSRVFDIIEPTALWLGVILLGSGTYTLARTLLDLARPLTLTGEVLRLDKSLLSIWAGDEMAYLVLDDGRGDSTTAWILPSSVGGTCRDGDAAQITVHRWSRRVLSLVILERSPRPVEPAEEGMDRLLSAMVSDRATGQAVQMAWWLDFALPLLEGIILDAPIKVEKSPETLKKTPDTAQETPETAAETSGAAEELPVTELLTAAEVGAALGVPVDGPVTVAKGRSLRQTGFVTTEDARAVLLISGWCGASGRLAWRKLARGRSLLGIGSGAYVKGSTGVVRVGDAVVMLITVGERRSKALPHLLSTVGSRLTEHFPG